MNTLVVAKKLVRHALDTRDGGEQKPAVGDDRALVWIAAVGRRRDAWCCGGQGGGDTGHRGRKGDRGLERSEAGVAPKPQQEFSVPELIVYWRLNGVVNDRTVRQLRVCERDDRFHGGLAVRDVQDE